MPTSLRYLVGRDMSKECDEIVASAPLHMRRLPLQARSAAARGIAFLSYQGMSYRDAAKELHGKVQAYAESYAGKFPMKGGLAAWVDGGGFLADPKDSYERTLGVTCGMCMLHRPADRLLPSRPRSYS